VWLVAGDVLAAGPGWLRFEGQASGWLRGSYDTSLLGQAGLRYIPALAVKIPLGKGTRLSAELSANGWLNARYRQSESLRAEYGLKPYRLSAEFALPRFDARLGLQKINFGSATMLRPLMWFDRIDPRDPLQLTDGVYGLLARYYFGKGGNVWAWGLLGNDSTKGWEWLGTEPGTPEAGGRIQVPVPSGELAASYHYRQALDDRFVIPEVTSRYYEHRLGLDGKWDVGVGLWFEGVAVLSTHDNYGWPVMVPTWQRMVTVGADYTVGVGKGLGLLAEHLLADQTEQFGKLGERPAQFTALSVSYPLGLLDNLRALVYYDWRNKGFYRFLSWQRTLDNWTFNVAAFWNPDPSGSQGVLPGSTAGSGKGLQVTVAFNH
jgi:hypothetical protein